MSNNSNTKLRGRPACNEYNIGPARTKYAVVVTNPDGSEYTDRLCDTAAEAQSIVDFENHFLDPGETPLKVVAVKVRALS